MVKVKVKTMKSYLDCMKIISKKKKLVRGDLIYELSEIIMFKSEPCQKNTTTLIVGCDNHIAVAS